MSINRNLITVLCISVFLVGLSLTKTLKRGRHPELIDFCLRDEVYVGIPWNCHGYIHCQNANGLKMPFWMDCPSNLYFNYDSKTCTWPKNVNQPCPNVGDVAMSFCPEYPNVHVLHPDSCAQYYDCSNRNQLPNRPPYLSECPYPKLFNAETLRCDDFSAVDCGTRQEPLSPCDYVRHQCNGEPGCTPCTDLIPGCEGVPDGRNAYQGRLLTKFYLICQANKTKQIEICPTGVFDPVQGICTKDVDPRAVDILCTTNPRARMEHPGHCARYFDCRSRETGEVIKECPYPRLYSPTKQACVDFEEVDCTGKLEPKSPCEYLEYQCKGKNCPICEIENPSCEGLPNGKNAYLGKEETAWYIECRNDRLMDKRSCPGNAIFDPVNRMCPGENIQGPIFEKKVPIDPTTIDETGRLITPATDPIMLPPPVITVTPPSMRQPGLPTDPTILRPDLRPDYGLLNDICRGYEGRILPDLTNCGRYYNCSRYALQYKDLALNQDECAYPQLFSEEMGYCMDFSNVSCGSRYIPKAPCQYVSTQNNCQGPMCDLPCEERSPSCVGMRNGNNTFVGRELSPFYISCYMDRTLSVGICRYGVFDPTLRYCTTELDPYSVEVFCTERPTKVFPHIANCARYYDCRAKEVDPALGRYIRECPYPDLFNIESLRCVSRANAKCRWRYEPKDPCEWKQNQYCEDPKTCGPCAVRFNGCRQKEDGNHPVPHNNFQYLQCLKGEVVNLLSCQPNTYDPINRECSTAGYDCKGLPNGKNPMPGNEMGYIMCRNNKYEGKDTCAPDFYDRTNRICRPRFDKLSCEGLSDGLYPMPEAKTAYFRCEGNVVVEFGSCDPQRFDPVKQRCLTASDRLPPPPKITPPPIPPIFTQPTTTPPTPPTPPTIPQPRITCEGRPNGFNVVPGSATEFFICSNGRLLGYDTCKPNIFDFVQNSCAVAPCAGMADGPLDIPGNDVFFIICEAQQMIQLRSCEPGVFDPVSKVCVDKRTVPFDPSDPVQFCLENPTAIMAHPENCARFIDCNKRDSMIGPYQQECKYPDLFDSYNNSCKSYRQVMCGTRPEPKAPCDYQLNSICKDLLGNCPPCEINNPSCIGKRDGPQAVDGRPNFFLECQDERTKSLTECPATAPNFDPVLGSCTMGLDPSNPGPYCKDNPSVVTPHPDNCAQYIDCRQRNTPIGNYIQECPFPLLVSTTDTNSATPCQSFDTVQCGRRREIINPCDYQLNNEPCYEADPSKCVPCSVRYPSCEGKTDGKHAHPTEPTKYLICKSQRTLRVMTCPKGTFRERSGNCIDRFNRRDPAPYCQANPTERFVDPENCARFFDCSLPDSKYGPYVDECEYPKLFSRKYKRCRPFTKVSCGKRTIPIDACEYLQNQNCKPGEPTCEPCTERIPSCIGLPNGNNSFPGREGQPIYITCFRDRTIFVRMCDRGVFDPVQRACVTVEDLNPENPKPYCDAFPTAKIAHPDNCAQYFDCSNPEGPFGAYQFECKYPSLFNTELGDCSIYNSVTCGTRFEPKEPCDYVKNQCPANADVTCEPCRDRLPSCVGRQNGNNTFPGRYLSSDFIVCWDDRTISVEQCPEGYFDPARGRCRTDIGASDIRAFCDQNPGVIKENPVNCAQYFDCGEESIKAKTFLRECPYPMLFNDKTSTCQNFSYVICGKRREYVAPCDYLQNRCNPAIRDCVPCPERHPSCVGLPDGFNAVPNQPMSDEYIICDKERTISSSEKCASGFFDPKRRRCLREVTEDMISRYCRRNPRSIRAHPFQCAQYYDCRRAIQGSHLRECKYPQLFDVDTLSCRNFTNVDCQNRFVPQAPCDYLQNHCPPNATNCMPCEDRLPSCINLPDRNNQYPGQRISEYYIKCFRNRTVSVEACQVSMYDPITRECSANVEPTIMEKYCKENPSRIIPDPANCGRYYNCSDKTIVRGLEKSYLRECTYPKLFASPAVGCQLFMMVNCHGRLQTPMKPCDYVENQCANGTCDPLACEAKFPHCLGKQDGSNIFPGRENTEFYIVCYRQRTVAIVSCTVGIYSHKDRACVGEPPYPQLPP